MRYFWLLCGLLLGLQSLFSQTYRNPVIPGFYPDPSICRVGDDYYLVTSTFEYFPGVPVFHSKDLVHWTQIGHCLTRQSQLPLQGAAASMGIWAPTIRYANGLFYMVVSQVMPGWKLRSFYVYTHDPAGEWSDPVYYDSMGIDPSLYFHDDGTCYIQTGTTWDGNPSGIYQSQIDIKTGKLLTKPALLWRGSGGSNIEAPHLYKIGDWFYLTTAEGGTEYGHMVTVARSKSLWGPFEGCPHNPILTHRGQSGVGNRIQGTGHADLIQAHDGSWWMVFLGFRKANGDFHHLGRETFLAPVSWTADGWPVVNQNGTVSEQMNVATLPLQPADKRPVIDNFSDSVPGLDWNFLRNPDAQSWSLTERSGFLRLKGLPVTLDSIASPAWLGRRQQHFSCKATTRMAFRPKAETDEAGLCVYMNDTHYYTLAVTGTSKKGQAQLIVRNKIGHLNVITKKIPVKSDTFTLQIEADAHWYHFYLVHTDGSRQLIDRALCKYLSSEVAGGYTGVYLGLYATGNGKKATVSADFDWFSYEAND